MQIALAHPGVGALIFTWIGDHVTRIETHSRPDLYALNVLQYCERYGWIEDPALLVRMLEKVAQAPHTRFGASLPGVAARMRLERPDAAIFYRGRAVWETCHLSVALPFLGRSITRSAFQDFFLPLAEGARALIVNGPPGSGRTFTGDFLRLLVGLRKGDDLAQADALALAGEMGPRRLAVQLAAKIGGSEARAEAMVPHLNTQRPDRWLKDIVICLVEEANRSRKTWHLLLDNFHLPADEEPRPVVPEATHDLIALLLAALSGQQEIAWDVRDPVMGAPLRLVLTGYTRELWEPTPLVRVDDIQPLGVDDLRSHFRRYFAYKEWPVDDAEVERIVARYEPHLTRLFPGRSGWKMRELAKVVLLDCEHLDQERGRNGRQG